MKALKHLRPFVSILLPFCSHFAQAQFSSNSFVCYINSIGNNRNGRHLIFLENGT